MYQRFPDLQEPLVPFEWLWRIYQQCDSLNVCISSYVDNICNTADLFFSGPPKEKDTDERKAEEIEMQDFFAQVNERLSFLRLRRKMERSFWITNLWFVQVFRDENILQDRPEGGFRDLPAPNRLYYIPSIFMRATPLGEDLVPVKIRLRRQGKLLDMETTRKFRRFARINPVTQELTWFRELGDPRILNTKTGVFYRHPTRQRNSSVTGALESDFLYASDGVRMPNEATEIWWHRENYEGSIYGLPKWFSAFWDVKGRNEAKWVNYDHLDRGAIIPGFFAISGGRLKQASKDVFDNFLESFRNPGGYNKIPYLEIEPEIELNINADGSSARSIKIEWVKLRDPQHEDLMFDKYLERTEETIGSVFRLPPVLRGKTNTETYASAATAIEITESQVFQPIRAEFDSKVTVELLQNEFGIYGWEFRTHQSKIGDKETFYRAIGALNRASALSINDTRELANQLLGTSFKPFKGAVYSEPVTLVTSLANQGMVSFSGQADSEGGTLNGALEFIGAIAAAANTITDNLDNPDEKSAKSDADVKAEAVEDILSGLKALKELGYEAPNEDDINIDLLPKKQDVA